MAYDEDLANWIRSVIQDRDGVAEKQMFGGLAFLVNGNLAVSASGQGGLLLRVDPAETSSVVRRQGVTVRRCAGARWRAGCASNRLPFPPMRNSPVARGRHCLCSVVAAEVAGAQTEPTPSGRDVSTPVAGGHVPVPRGDRVVILRSLVDSRPDGVTPSTGRRLTMLWTILVILAIVALVLFIMGRVREAAAGSELVSWSMRPARVRDSSALGLTRPRLRRPSAVRRCLRHHSNAFTPAQSMNETPPRSTVMSSCRPWRARWPTELTSGEHVDLAVDADQRGRRSSVN